MNAFINIFLFGLFGAVAASGGLTYLTWQFWVLITIMALVLFNSVSMD